MPIVEELCKEMGKNQKALTFSEIGLALAQGAVVGQRTPAPGGAVIGATLNLSLVAGKRAVAIADEMLKDLKQSKKNKPSS